MLLQSCLDFNILILLNVNKYTVCPYQRAINSCLCQHVVKHGTMVHVSSSNKLFHFFPYGLMFKEAFCFHIVTDPLYIDLLLHVCNFDNIVLLQDSCQKSGIKSLSSMCTHLSPQQFSYSLLEQWFTEFWSTCRMRILRAKNWSFINLNQFFWSKYMY